jgi:hypothetical protein
MAFHLSKVFNDPICSFSTMVLKIGSPQHRKEVISDGFIIVLVCGEYVVRWVSQHHEGEFFSFSGSPLFNFWPLHKCQEQVCLLKRVHHYSILVVCILEVIEHLKEHVHLASFSCKEDGHGSFQCSISWCRCCWR